MNDELTVFAILLIVNTLLAGIYFAWGCITQREEKKAEEGKRKNMDPHGYALNALIILLCPVVGVVFLAVSRLVYLCFFRSEADLEDVIFGKTKVIADRKAEEERERNRVPLEEALAVCDKDSLRELMLDIIQGNVDNTLSSIVLALDSEDTETSHYAAAVLRDALNEFRRKSQELYNAMKDEENEQADVNACMLIEYMNGILSQEVFTELEQNAFVTMMDEACEYLYQKTKSRYMLICDYLEWLCVRLLRIKRYGRVEYWSRILEELYPDELAAYTVQLKLFFSIQDRERFFDVLDRLKQSSVVIDRDTLDLIRVFS